MIDPKKFALVTLSDEELKEELARRESIRLMEQRLAEERKWVQVICPLCEGKGHELIYDQISSTDIKGPDCKLCKGKRLIKAKLNP